jgi:hypothetical protein
LIAGKRTAALGMFGRSVGYDATVFDGTALDAMSRASYARGAAAPEAGWLTFFKYTTPV